MGHFMKKRRFLIVGFGTNVEEGGNTFHTQICRFVQEQPTNRLKEKLKKRTTKPPLSPIKTLTHKSILTHYLQKEDFVTTLNYISPLKHL